VVIEAALQAPRQTAAVILVDGSQFAAAMEPVLMERFASPEGYEAITGVLFNDMFTAKSDKAVAAAVVDRVFRLPRTTGEKMLKDLLRYDVARLTASLGSLCVPVLALQTTFSNEKRQRTTMKKGQTTPYLDRLRANVPDARIEIIEDTGHFPQLDESARTNEAIDDFLVAARLV
jgi:pimeloyl-ACP methyl ester carboxylesterase